MAKKSVGDAARVAAGTVIGRAYYTARHWKRRAILMRRSPAPVRSLAQLYPDAVVRDTLEPERCDTPELERVRLHGDWDHVDQRSIETPAAWIAEIDDAMFDAPRNIMVSRDRKSVVADSVGYIDEHNANIWPPAADTFMRKPVAVEGTATTFRCFVHHRNHYHAMVDGLPRLFPVITDPRYADTEIKVLVDHELSGAERFFLENLLPNNMVPFEVPGDALLQIERLVLPSYITITNVGYLPQTYLDWFVPAATPDRPPAGNERIYVSRGDVGIRKVLNESELLTELGARGFMAHNLADLSVDEQARLFYDAELVVSGHGAGLTNLVFGTGAGVVELFNSPFVRPHYYYLSKAVGHRWRHVTGPALKRNDDFEVDIAAVCRHLDELEAGAP